MIQIQVTQGALISKLAFDDAAKAQKFLEGLKKQHIKRFGLTKIENLKKKKYKECHKGGSYKSVDQQIYYAVKAHPAKPIPLKVEICHT